jgi:tubulin-like protein CetZ
MTVKVGFLGIGQAGSNICEIAELYEYRTAIINTSPEDLDSIQLIKNKLLVGRNGGAGKDRKIAKGDVKGDYKKITEFVSDKFKDTDIELIYVVFSTGGGTGSGMGPLVIDLLTKMIPNKKFGAIAVLPSLSESTVAQVNSIDCLRELVDLNVPSFIVDNDKYSRMNPSSSRKQLFDTVNNAIVDDFNLILNTKRQSSKYGNVDTKDLIKLLSTPGASVIGVADLDPELVKEGQTIQKQIIKSWEESTYAQMEYDGVVKRMGFIWEVDDRLTKLINYEELNREVGNPLEVFEGIYRPSEDGEQSVISVLTGLSFPEDRMLEVNEQLEKNKEGFAAKKDYSVLASTDTSWFSEAREETTVKKSNTIADDDDLEDLFSKYN